MTRLLFALLTVVTLTVSANADWPTYRKDANRSGYSSDTLPEKLGLKWVYESNHAPQPAWPTSDRMPFDRAYQTVIADGILYFGSSTDCSIHALDAATGESRWQFATNAPVRFAPTVWQGRVYATSDDSYLYCLDAKNGSLLWKHRGGKDNRMILGNDRVISRWPARGGAAIRDGIVYYAAGVWPSDGIFLHALDAKSGKVIWTNDKSGSIYMPQPHGGANANSGVSAQGYLVVTDKQMFVPTGRAVPASFERASGKFQYFHLQANRAAGGTPTMATNDAVFNSGLVFDALTGKTIAKLGARAVTLLPDGAAASTGDTLTAYQWKIEEKRDRKGQLQKHRVLAPILKTKVDGGTALIAAGKDFYVGGKDRVSRVRSKEQKVTWSAKVDGTIHGLAIANDCLFVTTDQGKIYCFGESNGTPIVRKSTKVANPYGTNEDARRAVDEILKKSGMTEGYCVDLGCGDGSLAYELAKRTDLHIIAIDSDAKNVELARRKLQDAGLYGVRVTVHQGDYKQTNYPKYFASLVVSQRSLNAGKEAVPDQEVYRLQRPYGGVACLGKIGEVSRLVRGAVKGAGNWTHQYADAGNTCNSGDDAIKGPLGMLWFRDSDFAMPQRHGRGPAPLFFQGYLIVEGLHGIRVADAYTGRKIWEYELKDILKAYDADHLVGTAATNSNLCVSKEGVFVRVGNRCLRLDLATGKKLNDFVAPKSPNGKVNDWGYIACQDGVLYGSVVNNEHIVKHAYLRADMSELFTESDLFFALDAKTGKTLWQFQPKHSIRHNAIALGNGKVFLIDRPLAEMDRASGAKKVQQPEGTLYALDAFTGKTVWQSKEDIYGTTLAYSEEHDSLLMCYQSTRFRLPSELGGKLTVMQGKDGKRIWEKKANYATRPLINDTTIYAQGGAWDLKSGETRTFELKRSYGCGQLASSKYLMLFRSATLGYYDLEKSQGSIDYGGIRPGCWINAIPAGGLVLVPDASSGCSCSYLNRAWIGLQGMED